MKTLVYQTHSGPEPAWLEPSSWSAQRYAARIGAEYVLRRDPPPLSHYFGTFLPFFDGTHADYDAMLYLDTDTLVAPTAPNIFEEPHVNISALHLLEGPLLPGKKEEVQALLRAMGTQEGLPHGHANAGVILFPPGTSAPFAEWLEIQFESLASWSGQPQPAANNSLPYGGYDQCILNVYGIASRPLSRLDPRFSYHLSHFPPHGRGSAHITHYHGANKHLLLADCEEPNAKADRSEP